MTDEQDRSHRVINVAHIALLEGRADVLEDAAHELLATARKMNAEGVNAER